MRVFPPGIRGWVGFVFKLFLPSGPIYMGLFFSSGSTRVASTGASLHGFVLPFICSQCLTCKRKFHVYSVQLCTQSKRCPSNTIPLPYVHEMRLNK